MTTTATTATPEPIDVDALLRELIAGGVQPLRARRIAHTQAANAVYPHNEYTAMQTRATYRCWA